MASAGEVTAPPRNPFPFQHKPNALDRDKIVIPAGWDSWGKIAVLREGFDAKLWGEAWENDLDGSDDDAGPKATKLYDSLVPDLSRKVSDCGVRTLDWCLDVMWLASPTSASQQPDTRASIPGKELRRERQKSQQGSPWRVPEPQRSHLHGYRWPDGQQQLHLAKRRACIDRDGGNCSSRRQPSKYERRGRPVQEARKKHRSKTTTIDTLCTHCRRGHGPWTRVGSVTGTIVCYDA